MFDAGGVWLVDISFMLAGAFGLTRSYGSGDIYKNMVRACAIADVGMELTLGVWCGWAGGQMGRRSLRGSPERRPFCLPVGWPFASAYLDREMYLAFYQASGLGRFKYADQFVWWGASYTPQRSPLLRRGYPRGNWRIRA